MGVEEGYGGVEGERLQDIFCKLFQVRIVQDQISNDWRVLSKYPTASVKHIFCLYTTAVMQLLTACTLYITY